MSTSINFVGSGFSLEAVSALAPGSVRVRYTVDPQQSNPAGANDGRNPSNYVLTGPVVPPAISIINVVAGDPQSLDLILAAPLIAGTWTLTVANVQTPGSVGLTAPTSLEFTVTETGNITSLSGGADTDDSEAIIRKHLSQAMAGPNWDALIAALAVGDDVNWDNARLAFDQLFKSTASGKYLDRISANDGVIRPPGIGMADDLFRELSIRVTNNKVVHEALREILEIYYGRDSLHAYAETETAEPFALADGMTLDLVLDEDPEQTLTHIFESVQFRAIGVASALEVSMALTKTLRDRGSPGFAVSFTDSETGAVRVRIYSGSLGLKSFVRITGGTAQPLLEFPRRRLTYSGSVVPGSGYNWVYTLPAPGQSRLSLTTTGSALIDVSTVESGDYIIIGADAESVAGIFPVASVSYSWSGGNLTQVLDLGQDIGFTGTALQLSNDAYTFFKPEKRTILSGDRTVVVAQTRRGQIDVQIPATTQAVGRSAREAAYGRVQTSLPIAYYVRDQDGTTTLTFASNPGAGAGDQVLIEGVAATINLPYVSAGVPGTYPAVATADAGYGSVISQTQVPPTPVNQEPVMVRLGNGDVLVAGGVRFSGGGVFQGEASSCNRIRVTGTAAVIDSNPDQAYGSTRYLYQFQSTTSMSAARQLHAGSMMVDGRALISGGLNNGATVPVYLNSVEIYDSGIDTWTAAPAMAMARAGHRQVTLNDGRVMVIGGTGDFVNATNSCEFFDPGTNTWTSGPNMTTARYGHAAVKLSDGRVMVIGGTVSGLSNEFWPSPGTQSGPFTATTEIYDPGLPGWVTGPAMELQRCHLGAILLESGDVMVVEGLARDPNLGGSAASTASTEFWDSGSNRWDIGPKLHTARVKPLLGRVPDAGVWIAGGGVPGIEIFRENSDLVQLSYRQDTRLHDSVAAGADSHPYLLLSGGRDQSLNTWTSYSLWIPGADSLGAGGLNGFHSVSSGSGNQVQIQTPAYPDFASSYGSIRGPASMTLVSAAARPSQDPGPYVFDPGSGLGVAPAAIPDAILSGAIVNGVLVPTQAGSNYSGISITSSPQALPDLPDGPGYLVLDFGGPHQSQPIKYLKSFRQDAFTLTLLIDFSYRFEANYDGASVTMLRSRSPFVPDLPLESANFYVTGSSIGRVIAEASVRDAAAAGFNVNVTVVYPGDRGLGGEGYPTAGAGKLSDSVRVWGGDDLDSLD